MLGIVMQVEQYFSSFGQKRTNLSLVLCLKMEVINQLDVPPWAICVSEIMSMLEEICEDSETISSTTQMTALKVDAVDDYILRFTLYERLSVKIHLPFSKHFLMLCNDTDSNPEKASTSLVTQQSNCRSQISELEKRRETSRIVLECRYHFSNLAEKLQQLLDAIPPGEDKEAFDYYPIPKKSKKTEFLSEHLDEIRNLKKELIEIVAEIDEELFKYSTMSSYNWAEMKVLSDHKKNIEILLGQLNVIQIKEHLSQFSVKQSPGQILADIIGLQKEVGFKVFCDTTDHGSEEYQLKKLLEDAFCNFEEDDFALTTADQLLKLGFSEKKATYIASKIANDDHHCSSLKLAFNFVEDLFRYDLLLTDNPSGLPDWSNEDTYKNEFFFESSKGVNDSRNISCRNVLHNSKLEQTLHRFLVDQNDEAASKSEPGFQYWYHGTKYGFAKGIAKKNIDLHKGWANLDFSDDYGFYVTNGMKTAMDKALKNKYCAILRFKIPAKVWEKYPRGLKLWEKYPDKDDEAEKTWKDVIINHRTDDSERSADVRKMVENVPFIKGPISSGGPFSYNGWPKPQPGKWIQLCLLQPELAKDFDQYLDKIAYFTQDEQELPLKK